jgi:hypothetical protein
MTTIDMRDMRETTTMNAQTDYAMFQARDRMDRLATEARSERLAAGIAAPTVRTRLGIALLRLGTTLAPEARSSLAVEPTPFPRVDRGSDRVDLRPAA